MFRSTGVSPVYAQSWDPMHTAGTAVLRQNTRVYTHVLNGGGQDVESPVDRIRAFGQKNKYEAGINANSSQSGSIPFLFFAPGILMNPDIFTLNATTRLLSSGLTPSGCKAPEDFLEQRSGESETCQ